MRIVQYRLELDKEQHGILVEEKLCVYPGTSLSSPQTVANMLNAVFYLNRQAEEHVYMIAMNAKNKPLGIFEVSHGAVNQSICNPREIYVRALLCGAVGIILVHNHPSGDTRPSEEDIAVYNRIQEAGKLLGISLLDSLIVGDDYFSFAESLQETGEIINLD